MTFGDDVDLSAGSFLSDGGAITLNAQDIASPMRRARRCRRQRQVRGRSLSTPTRSTSAPGARPSNGFGSVTMNATGGIVGQGNRHVRFWGAADHAQCADQSRRYEFADEPHDHRHAEPQRQSGHQRWPSARSAAPSPSSPGRSTTTGATIEAPRLQCQPRSTSGNLTLASGSLVSSQGVAKLFFDITEFCARRQYHADGGHGIDQCRKWLNAELRWRARRRRGG